MKSLLLPLALDISILASNIFVMTGCIMPPHLGARYHRFEHKGEQYVTCTVVAQADRPKLAAAALQLCKDAVEDKPALDVGNRGKLDQK
jgi:hypothetical protein